MKDQVIKERLQAQAERERLENRLHQSQRLESLGLLAGGVAHDFNNLLAVILTCASFVAEATAENEPVRADVDQIKAAAERAARLTRQLLIFGRRDKVQHRGPRSRRRRGRHPGPAGPQHRRGRHAGRASDGQDLPADPRGPGPDGTGAGQPRGQRPRRDAGRGHADDQAGRDHARRGLRAAAPPITPGHYVELSVSDTGVGMPPEIVSRIFEPFFTTKTARTRGPGWGWLPCTASWPGPAAASASTPSRAWARPSVPSSLPRTSTPQRPPSRPRTTATRGRGETVLVVEDEPAVRQITARILRRNGYSVLEAASGAEALTLAADHHFDMLLTDLVMPQVSGPELAQRIQQMHPGSRCCSCRATARMSSGRAGRSTRTRPSSRSRLPRWNF